MKKLALFLIIGMNSAFAAPLDHGLYTFSIQKDVPMNGHDYVFFVDGTIQYKAPKLKSYCAIKTKPGIETIHAGQEIGPSTSKREYVLDGPSDHPYVWMTKNHAEVEKVLCGEGYGLTLSLRNMKEKHVRYQFGSYVSFK